MNCFGLIKIAGLLVYLFGLMVISVWLISLNFPSDVNGELEFPNKGSDGFAFSPFGFSITIDQGLILLALLSGITGSFIHTAQSIASYLGNEKFKENWIVWYLLRPWIGCVLGLSVYIVIRAGLVSAPSAVTPYGVVALGLLGGWFSKPAADKLEEVFEMFFKTNKDEKRSDKLTG